jgi:hypothetical protein
VLFRSWARSSWEVRVVEVLDIHPWVRDIEIEPVEIPYEFEGVRHTYLPDFRITFQDGIQEMWEVKADYLLNDPKWLAKLEALNKYITEYDMNSRVVNQSELEGMEMLVGIRPWTLPYENDFDPNDPKFMIEPDDGD